MDQTGAYNLCLGRLGIGQAVGAPTDRTVPAQTCNRFFDQCRQEVLRAFPWGFALAAEPLALVAGQSFPGWAYVYQVPDKCITVRAVADEGGLRVIRDVFSSCDLSNMRQPHIIRGPWQIALKEDGASQVILTDISDAWGFFTKDVTNTGAWPVDFGSVIAWRLAMEVGGPLAAKRELIERAENAFLQWFSWATAATMNEQRDDSRAESPSIACRA